jgi:hypothetical protein
MMNSPETALPQFLERLLSSVGGDDNRKVIAVRWFNRLYFEVEKWNRDFIALLNSFPSQAKRATKRSLAEFDDKLVQFASGLEGKWSAEKWDLCCNLRILSVRFARDFAWLEKRDRGCYWQLRQLIDEAYGNEKTIIDNARLVIHNIRGLRSLEDKGRDEIWRIIAYYKATSRAAVNQLQSVAENAGVTLLTLEQYQLALDTRGSFDSALIVLGDVSVSTQHFSGGDFKGCSFGDNNSVASYFGNVEKMQKVESEAKQKLKEAREAAEKEPLSDEDKADLVQQLISFTKELEQPKQDPSRLKRFLGRIEQLSITVASILSSAASIAKVIGG